LKIGFCAFGHEFVITLKHITFAETKVNLLSAELNVPTVLLRTENGLGKCGTRMPSWRPPLAKEGFVAPGELPLSGGFLWHDSLAPSVRVPADYEKALVFRVRTVGLEPTTR
jgi:hypothetical protein